MGGFVHLGPWWITAPVNQSLCKKSCTCNPYNMSPWHARSCTYKPVHTSMYIQALHTQHNNCLLFIVLQASGRWWPVLNPTGHSLRYSLGSLAEHYGVGHHRYRLNVFLLYSAAEDEKTHLITAGDIVFNCIQTFLYAIEIKNYLLIWLYLVDNNCCSVISLNSAYYYCYCSLLYYMQ